MKITILALSIVAFAAQAFAAAPPATLQGFNATKNVTIDYDLQCTNNCWIGASGHSSGDKNFATSSAFGGIAQKTVVPGTDVAAPTNTMETPTDSTLDTSWTKM